MTERTLLLLCAAILLARSAQGQTDAARASAREHYGRGVELVAEGRYEQALSEFLAAYDEQPHYRALYNIGQTYIELDRPMDAIRALEQYLYEGKDQIPPERVEQVRRQITEQQRRTAPDVRVDTLAVAAPASTPPVPSSKTAPSALVPPAVAPPVAVDPQPRSSTVATLGYWLAGAGLALGGVALGHYFWNRERFERWQTEHGRLEGDDVTGQIYFQRQSDNNALAASIERASHWTVALSVAGGALLTSGASLVIVGGTDASEAESGVAGAAFVVRGVW